MSKQVCNICGQGYCCHQETEKKIIKWINECGKLVTFSRESCRSCGLWLGDNPISVE